MKFIKIAFILNLIGFLINTSVYAGVPTWQVNSANYSNSMSITGVLKLDNIESVDENDIVAAFVNDECRGVVKPTYIEAVDRYEFFLLIYSNEVSGEELSFKAYDADQDLEIDLINKKEFIIDQIAGSISNPYLFTNIASENSIESFNISGLENQTTIDKDSKTVNVTVPFGSDISNLVAEFSLSEGSVAYVNEQEQTSGSSSNDFTNPVSYTIVGLDGSEQVWEVTVIKSDEPTGLINDKFSDFLKVYPIPANDYLNCELLQGQEGSFRILDLNGNEVISLAEFEFVHSKIDVSALQKGIYVIQVLLNNKIYNQTFVKD